MPDKLLHKHLTDKILTAFYNVYNTLGLGFLEKVCENALAIEMRSMGLRVANDRKRLGDMKSLIELDVVD
jgi:GxxExxY protein